ncbi:MAG: hypothetical protein K2X75_04075 [Burkholderiaceae bacterium]|jgi:hypothetical protein|nr:hypothetical protein [Burkholderiaceae bacterium]
MKLEPYVRVDDTAFTTTPEQLLARLGPPRRRVRNDVQLDELDYGHTVYRFQDSGRLEEVTQRTPVLHLEQLAVPFVALAGFIRSQDPEAFERAGFLVSPRYGLAFVPREPDWVTALAAHCIPTWRALR